MSSYIPIASQTLASSASSVTFSSIPTTLNGKTLRDLVLVMGLQANTGVNVFVKPNNDTNSANYSYIIMGGLNGSSSGFSGSNSGGYAGLLLTAYAAVNSTDQWSGILQIMDYAQTNKHKSTLARVDSIPQATSAIAGRWASTSAISSLVIDTGTSNTFSSGSTFSLFGLEG
jgi:hypothetical protein